MNEKATAMKPPPLKISRVFHAPRSTVFRAWTSSEHVKAWFCPETYSVPKTKVESRLGGAFEVCMRSPSGEEHWMRGVFEEIEPDRRLVITSQVESAAGAPLFRARTEVDFSDALGGTRMDLMQTYSLDDPNIAARMVAGAAEGWRTTLDRLEAEVVRMQGGVGTQARSVVHASFRLERAYGADKARVWEALTGPEAKMKWFAGTAGEWELIERAMDVRVGGRERLKGRWKGGVVSTFEAIYHDVVEGERLIYSYEMFLNEKKISVSLATMELAFDGAKTLLKVTEQGAFLDGYDDAGSRERGTGLLLDALGASLSN